MQVLNIVNTNNGVESLNRLFKYTYFPLSIDKSVYGIVVMIVSSFLPDSYQSYLSANLRLSSSYRKYDRIVHNYLQNRPPHFVKQCLKNKFVYKPDGGKISNKKPPKQEAVYLVQFLLPSCSCESWRR